jgi:haloacetate dehalogenase
VNGEPLADCSCRSRWDPGGENHVDYSKRTMARDQVAVMHALGHRRFAVIGHDRGGRVAHRMALDHLESLSHVVLLDIVPTSTMYARTDRVATRYFWLFFLIQPAPLPERLIENAPEFFLRNHLAAQSRTPGVPDEALIREYLRCYHLPGTIHAICEDYRAAANIDLEHDAADSNRAVEMPLLALLRIQGRRRRTLRRSGYSAGKSDSTARKGAGLRTHHSGGSARALRRCVARVSARADTGAADD